MFDSQYACTILQWKGIRRSEVIVTAILITQWQIIQWISWHEIMRTETSGFSAMPSQHIFCTSLLFMNIFAYRLYFMAKALVDRIDMDSGRKCIQCEVFCNPNQSGVTYKNWETSPAIMLRWFDLWLNKLFELHKVHGRCFIDAESMQIESMTSIVDQSEETGSSSESAAVDFRVEFFRILIRNEHM